MKWDVDIESARALVADKLLWPRVRDFLWDFPSQIHPSHLDDPALAKLLSSESAHIKKWILEALKIQPCFHLFPKDDWSRLALLDSKTLEAIAGWLGALSFAPALRRVTDSKTVRALKAALPGIYPGVLSFTMYFTNIALEDASIESPEAILKRGYGMLFSLCRTIPEDVMYRLRLKLPKQFSDETETAAVGDAKTLAPALKRLMKLEFPEAYSLCC